MRICRVATALIRQRFTNGTLTPRLGPGADSGGGDPEAGAACDCLVARLEISDNDHLGGPRVGGRRVGLRRLMLSMVEVAGGVPRPGCTRCDES